jgi:ankyrin repeat protein
MIIHRRSACGARTRACRVDTRVDARIGFLVSFQIALKVPRVLKHSLIPGILAVLTCLPAGTRANAQVDNLIDAAGRGDLARVRALLTSGAKVNARANFGMTALIMASRNDRPDVVQALLAGGADVNARKSGDGEFTALYMAAVASK